jgi:hypothetical protein
MHLTTCLLVFLAAPSVEVKLTRDADEVTVTADEARTTITISSAKGIGGAKLSPGKEGWPKALRLDLNLKALEGFHITSGDLRVQTFLGSEKPEALRRQGEKWVPAKVDIDLAPIIKRDGDRIQIDLPPAWLDAKHKELRIEWVDFYRG